MKEETTAPVTVCDVQFRSATKFYYFDPNGLDVRISDTVIVDTAYGLEIGQCVHGNHDVEPKDVVAPLRRVRRLATENDKKIDAANRTREKTRSRPVRSRLRSCIWTCSSSRPSTPLTAARCCFFFTADGRVDFRELVKHLASTLRTRIELRQIGVRDKAKMVGGLGICGRPFCCRQFLDDFQPVSIKMAKTQNLSLNPTKISGTCGRLICCLNYEQAACEDLLRTSPRPESLRRHARRARHRHRRSICCARACASGWKRSRRPSSATRTATSASCATAERARGDEPILPDLSSDLRRQAPQEEGGEPEFATYLEPVVIRRSAETLEPAVVSKPARTSRRRVRASPPQIRREAERGGRGRADRAGRKGRSGRSPPSSAAESRATASKNRAATVRAARHVRRAIRTRRSPPRPRASDRQEPQSPARSPCAEDAGQGRAREAPRRSAPMLPPVSAAAKPSAVSVPDANSPAVDGASKPHRRRPHSRRRKPGAKPNEGAAE